METLVHWRRLGLALLVLCACALGVVSARPPPAAGGMEGDSALDLLLTREAQRLLDAGRIKRSQTANVTVSVQVDIGKSLLIIDFGPGFLPVEEDGSIEEIEQYISNTLGAYASQAGLQDVEVRILYEGRPFESYFPGSGAVGSRGGFQRMLTGAVLVSASHGWIRVHPGGEWELQRPMFHGVREDLITPSYAVELQRLLQERGGATVYRARRGGTDPHPESMRAWEEMSARYHLKALLPNRTDIWNHFANSTENDREVSDDIRARPYYANHLGVEGMISVHTNADETQTARGTRVYYHPRKPNDREFAVMALCYMKEVIAAQDGYGDFPVSASPSIAAHGENGFALMPSVVVEVAFHTNATDAVALQDPNFRAASMKGLEKGYRLFRDGKDCKPLKGEAIENVSMSQGSVREIEVPFEGYPQYPLRIVTRNVGCPPGWVCRDNEVTVDAPQPTPLKIALACNNAGSAPLFWETSLVDDDGVTSVPVRHRQQCIRSS